jgi:hypothetical protein
MLKSKGFSTEKGGFDSHALPPFILIKSNGSMSENRTNTHQVKKKAKNESRI